LTRPKTKGVVFRGGIHACMHNINNKVCTRASVRIIPRSQIYIYIPVYVSIEFVTITRL
jgi:hypothetical protein